MTLSDERLREIAAYQPLEFRISGSELISMARELLSRRASPHGDAGGRPSITEALRMMNCPRPCNHRPDEFTVGECVDAGECGCVAGNGLYATPGSSAGASIDRHAYRVAHIDPPSAPPQREGLEGALVVVHAVHTQAADLRDRAQEGTPERERAQGALNATTAAMLGIKALIQPIAADGEPT